MVRARSRDHLWREAVAAERCRRSGPRRTEKQAETEELFSLSWSSPRPEQRQVMEARPRGAWD